MSWIRRTTIRILFTLYININSKLRRQQTRGPLVTAISPFKDGSERLVELSIKQKPLKTKKNCVESNSTLLVEFVFDET